MKREWKGSLTVETAYLMPLVCLLLAAGLLLMFYFHDKAVISACAYETAVIGSTKAREKDGVEEEVLRQAFRERIRGKCILFPGAEPGIEIRDTQIVVTAEAARRGIRLTVVQTAALTEPEERIRSVRRIIG